MSVLSNVLKSKRASIGLAASYPQKSEVKPLACKEMSLGRGNFGSVLNSTPEGGVQCNSCQSPRFWQDSAGNQHCEICNPPLAELYVVSRIDYSATQSTGPAASAREFPPSAFTEGQWDSAGKRLLRKIAERESRSHTRKESQLLTPEQIALLDWARDALETGILPTEPVRLARYHAVSDPAKFVRFTLSHVDAYLPDRPPDLQVCLERLKKLQQSLIIT